MMMIANGRARFDGEEIMPFQRLFANAVVSQVQRDRTPTRVLGALSGSGGGPEVFSISDLEVYCYLKKHLPPPYAIVAEPSTSYFSEWQYCYCLHQAGREIARWQGDFRTQTDGALVRRAEAWLSHQGLI